MFLKPIKALKVQNAAGYEEQKIRIQLKNIYYKWFLKPQCAILSSFPYAEVSRLLTCVPGEIGCTSIISIE